ncbi:hypothetical protein MesoLj113c_45870 [Mesorhizobium sp. 113-3-9]|nr:hypothetical protein MesoLj113c_45870 [Mesorhizobium sp. 113-3-9]
MAVTGHAEFQIDQIVIALQVQQRLEATMKQLRRAIDVARSQSEQQPRLEIVQPRTESTQPCPALLSLSLEDTFRPAYSGIQRPPQVIAPGAGRIRVA